jgi:hypothetical protein
VTLVTASVPFTDGFEGASLNPFWTLEAGAPGNVTLTTETAHSGSQSLKLEAVSTYPWLAGVVHDYGSDQFGSVSVWVQTGSLCCGSAAGLQINGSSRWIAVLQRTTDGSLVPRFWPIDAPQEITPMPTISLTPGWHQLRIDSGAGGVNMLVDGISVYSTSVVAKFRTVSMDVWGGPGGSEYYDDFSATIDTGQPLYSVCPLYDPSKAVKSGATLPVKLQLCTATGINVSSTDIMLHAVSITQSSTSFNGEVQDSGNANPDSDFRYDLTLGGTGGYIFNLSTKGLTTGTYHLNFTVTGDAYPYSTAFAVR